MREYDEKTLKKVQKVELDILKDFIAICDKYHLDYFGIAGTCIGVIRHNGFIPWDDDIDIAMPRKDFELFVKYAEEELSHKYIVMNTEHDINYPLMTTRLMKKNTKFREHALAHIDCEFGIFLDIYPFDNLSDDPKKRKKQMLRGFVFSKLLILRSIPKPVLGFKGAKAKIVHFICYIVHFLLRLFGISKRWLYNQCYDACICANEEKDAKELDFICDTTPDLNIWKKSDIYPLQKLKFEDIEMNFPRNMHDNLTNAYGDYMQLPPVEKRKNHYPLELEFDD